MLRMYYVCQISHFNMIDIYSNPKENSRKIHLLNCGAWLLITCQKAKTISGHTSDEDQSSENLWEQTIMYLRSSHQYSSAFEFTDSVDTNKLRVLVDSLMWLFDENLSSACMPLKTRQTFWPITIEEVCFHGNHAHVETASY